MTGSFPSIYLISTNGNSCKLVSSAKGHESRRISLNEKSAETFTVSPAVPRNVITYCPGGTFIKSLAVKVRLSLVYKSAVGTSLHRILSFIKIDVAITDTHVKVTGQM